MRHFRISSLFVILITACSTFAEPLKIAVIPKGTTHVFWKSIEAGARQAGQETGVEIIWKGPLKENDRAQQITIVEQLVSEGIAGLALAPLDDTALRRPVQAAVSKKIPVVIMDSALKGEAGRDFDSFIATNNHKGGELAGEELVKAIGGKGKIVLLRYQVGSASTTEREEGFLSVIRKNPDIHVLVENRYAGATSGEAKSASLNLLDKLTAADGVFSSNESATFGMLLALRQHNLAGKIKFVGFDSSPPLIEALQKGEIQALIAQNPRRMGYLSVKTLVDKIQGRPIPPTIDTGVFVLHRDNLETPEIKALLAP